MPCVCSRPPWITDLPTPQGRGQPVVPTGASVAHRSPAVAFGLTRCACPEQRPAPPLRASPGGPTPRIIESPFEPPKQPKPGTVWSSAQLPNTICAAQLLHAAQSVTIDRNHWSRSPEYAAMTALPRLQQKLKRWCLVLETKKTAPLA